MIKKIHYCWFGHKDIPPMNAKCIDSWKKFLPSWEIIRWDEGNFDIENAPIYVKKAYEEKMWAFVADYVRLHVLDEYGGLYLDTDMELIKNPEELFNNVFVTGFESKRWFSCGLIYAEPKNIIVSKLLEYYKNGTFDKHRKVSIPRILTITISNNKYGLRNGKYQKNEYLTVYPRDYFYPYNPYAFVGQTGITSNTYANHHYSASWQKREFFIIKLIKKINESLYKKK